MQNSKQKSSESVIWAGRILAAFPLLYVTFQLLPLWSMAEGHTLLRMIVSHGVLVIFAALPWAWNRLLLRAFSVACVLIPIGLLVFLHAYVLQSIDWAETFIFLVFAESIAIFYAIKLWQYSGRNLNLHTPTNAPVAPRK